MLVNVLFQLFHNFHVNKIVLRYVCANIKQIHRDSTENGMDTLQKIAGIRVEIVLINIIRSPFELNVITL